MFLFNRFRSWHGIEKVYFDDTFIVSYPRSGNTWMRFLLGVLLFDSSPKTFEGLEVNIPDIHTSLPTINNSLARPRFIKSHFAEMPPKGKVIYIFRDGRDCLLSFYYYLYPHSEGRPRFVEFLKDVSKDRSFGTWSNHIASALAMKKKQPDRIFLIKYESLVEQTEDCLLQVLEFLKRDITKEKLKSAIELCAWGNLRKMEQQTRKLKPGEVPFFRIGAIEQWRECFSETEKMLLGNDFEKVLGHLGYPT